MIAFQIKAAGTINGMQEYFAERPNGNLLATISPRLQQDGRRSHRFMNVCFMDGNTQIADGMDHAIDLIELKHFR